MVTSLLLCLHHHVTALIPNLGTVGTKVFTSRPAAFLRQMTQPLLSRILCGCQNWSTYFGVKIKCLPFPIFQNRFLHSPANRMVTVCLWYWPNQEIWIDL